MRIQTTLALLLLAPAAQGDVTLHALFGDHMVAQAEKPFRVFGTAEPGEEVTVRVGRTVAHGTTWAPANQPATAGDDGRFVVELGAFPAGGPCEVVVQGTNEIRLADVWFGEVWICSGQSNMQWTLEKCDRPEQVEAATAPELRLLQVPRRASESEERDVEATWRLCTPESAAGFSAVAYYFGRHVQPALGTKIGLIESAWGGTPAEAWAEPASFAKDPELAPVLAREVSREQHRPAALWNGMIAPLRGLSFRGAIWYQGEANAGRAHQYRKLFPGMIESWRGALDQGDFPFLFVQLANFRAIQEEPGDSTWAELREAQSMTLALPNTGMAVIIDIGEAKDIHPRNKLDVGRRLALSARKVAYGQPVVHSGPTFRTARFDGGAAVLAFDDVGGGLVARGEALTGFTVAGEDEVFHRARARIAGRTVVVTCDAVPAPVAVRYAWADNPVCNLYNAEGLPASPFRTDDWPGVTVGKE